MLPQTLIDRLRYVEIYTTRAVRNHRAGDYLSRIRGRSFEFDEHKPYQPGADIRQIDWNVTARMQAPFIKREMEEKELGITIMVDLSASMLFTSAAASKRDVGVEAAAALAFSAAAQNINTGLLAFTDRVECHHPPKRGKLYSWRLIESLYALRPAGRRTFFEPALELLAGSLKRTALVFCISDFIDADSFWNSRHLPALIRRVDFVPVVLEDRWEETIPETGGYVRFRDAEHGDVAVLQLTARRTRGYANLLRGRREEIRERFYRLGLDHIALSTDDDALKRIIAFFMSRRRTRR
jgi:uncharacterized protein (DUF58 family)